MASRTDTAHAVRAALLAVLLLALPRVAAAGLPWNGVFWSVGGAFSSTKADCRDCQEQEYLDTGTALARVGYSVSPRVRLGGEFTRTWRSQSGDAHLTTVSGIAQWNMVRALPIIMEFGYGISRVSYSVEQNNNVIELHRNGIALNLGVGSEWAVGPVAIGPYGAMYVAGLGDVQTATQVARDALVVSWFAGLTITKP